MEAVDGLHGVVDGPVLTNSTVTGLVTVKEIWAETITFTVIFSAMFCCVCGLFAFFVHIRGAKGEWRKWVWTIPVIMTLYGAAAGFVIAALPAMFIASIYFHLGDIVSHRVARLWGAAMALYVICLSAGLSRIIA